ncbi:MAG TPA: T9SS type A sorting domain-containing protein [Bacteroidia bacterium]|nr:T9SS type A sorting domain-containing protein [Bacteroidia bacterium]HRD37939.1 T9SS type A sorting domain-containing protein [Bacteroidia bacterium]
MKKIYTLILTTFSAIAFGQSLSAFQKGTTIIGPVLNGDEIHQTTSITTNTNSPTVTVLKIGFTNTSVTTVTVGVERTVIYQNPPLKLDGGGSFPDTYFCFGWTCFTSNVNAAPSSDYTILAPSDTSDNVGQSFFIDLVEGTTQGLYTVRYKLYNVNNANDTLSFTVRYNSFLNVSENKSVIESASDVFPNPANTNAFVNVTLKNEGAVKVQIYNSLGALVYSGNEQKFAPGKHKVNFDCGSLNSGIYFVTLNAGESKITKRMVINK